MKEVLPSLAQLKSSSPGIDGFLDYWAFWNAIDWLSIFIGMTLGGMWYTLCASVSGDLATALAVFPSQNVGSGDDRRISLDMTIHEAQKFLLASEIENLSGQDMAAYSGQQEAVGYGSILGTAGSGGGVFKKYSNLRVELFPL